MASLLGSRANVSRPGPPGAKKLYVLDMFPYPSGDGLHVGHPEGYTATDIVCRFKRMWGYDVLHPMGFDAFGLPAEEHAIKTNTPPRLQTEKNIDTFRRQLKMLGFSYDWDRELATTDVELFSLDAVDLPGPVRHLVRSAARAAAGRSPSCRFPTTSRRQGERCRAALPGRTSAGLPMRCAGQLVPGAGDGAGQRGSDRREERTRRSSRSRRIPLRQWMLRITAYADRLEHGLDRLDWSDSIKALQRNWIGRSSGAEVDFLHRSRGDFAAWQQHARQTDGRHKPDDDVLRIYTTRPDTLFGATYMVIAPEHPFVARLTTAGATGGGRRLLSGGRQQERPGADRTDQDQDGRLHRVVRHQSGQRRADPDLDRRLRADQLRHRRDHGRTGSRHARL